MGCVQRNSLEGESVRGDGSLRGSGLLFPNRPVHGISSSERREYLPALRYTVSGQAIPVVPCRGAASQLCNSFAGYCCSGSLMTARLDFLWHGQDLIKETGLPAFSV